MKRKGLLIIELLVLFLFIGAKAESSPRVVVIVNSQNPISEITTQGLRSIYYGQKTTWADGNKIEVVDLSIELNERKEFSQKVFNLDPAEVENKYTKLAFTGTGYPPKEVMSTPQKMLVFVAYNRQAIGYLDETTIAADPTLQAKVKIITVK